MTTDTYTCPNCGEDTGSPVMVTSREFQGEEAHGGNVEHEEEGCTLCVRRSGGES